MLDRKALRKRVLLGLLTSPVTMAPLMLGTTLLAGAVAVSNEPGMMAFGGVACVLGAIGTFLTRLVVGSDSMTEKAVNEMREEAARDRNSQLDELDRRLAGDRDQRTETALRDLRAFQQVFADGATWTRKLNAASEFDILSSVQDLFEGCVKSLEATYALWEAAQALRTREARQPILDRREEIIGDVAASIKQLSRIMIGIQKLGAEDGTESDLSRIRSELDESLSVARKVEQKMRTWQDEALEYE